MTEHPELCVADAAAWRAWLDANENTSDGVWLVLAKKGTADPTSLRYDEALDEALCSGWIDGQKRSRDATTFLQRFTPRRARSMWSLRNTEHIARLEADGRMRPRGRTEVDKAQADGRWERAYPGSADAGVPEDLARALAADPTKQARFEALTKAQRYSILPPLMSAATPETRARRLAKALAGLGEDANPACRQSTPCSDPCRELDRGRSTGRAFPVSVGSGLELPRVRPSGHGSPVRGALG